MAFWYPWMGPFVGKFTVVVVAAEVVEQPSFLYWLHSNQSSKRHTLVGEKWRCGLSIKIGGREWRETWGAVDASGVRLRWRRRLRVVRRHDPGVHVSKTKRPSTRHLLSLSITVEKSEQVRLLAIVAPPPPPWNLLNHHQQQELIEPKKGNIRDS